MSVEERLSPGQSEPGWDFSDLHGFQFSGARDGSGREEASEDEPRTKALTLELDGRAARFHQAVDSSIIIASDGTIRWLGDSVAQLAAGDDVLAPRMIPLIDEAMSADAQRLVGVRLEMWLKATVHRLLGPLFSLRAMEEGSGQLQDLAVKVVDALGVLEREPVRGVVRGLDQNSRALLRKHGVRFGSYYLYMPSALRPASRALALQLWCVRKGDEEFRAAAQGLIPMTSSGRTSAPPDPLISPETYRVGGFRLCGDRVVRVDIVERLADMIRVASTMRVVNGSDGGPSAFQVNGQMTSLTGCSGDSFSSILRALGFESLTVDRGEIIWPAVATPVPTPGAPSQASGPAAEVREDSGDADDDSVSAHALEEASYAADQPPDDCSASKAVDGLIAEPTERSGDGVAPSEPLTAIKAGEKGGGIILPQPSSAPVEDEKVTVWRFARSPTPNRPRSHRLPRGRVPAPGEPHVQPERAVGTPARIAPGGEGRADEKRPAMSEKPVFGGKRKNWDTGKTHRTPDEKRDGRTASVVRSSGERKTAIDPTSPFAKLMELRSILESESKKRS